MVLKQTHTKKKSKHNTSVRWIIIIVIIIISLNFICKREKNMDQNEHKAERKRCSWLCFIKATSTEDRYRDVKLFDVKSGWGAEHKGCYTAVRRKFIFLCVMCGNPHNSVYVHFLLNKYTVVLFLNKKKKINARQTSAHKQPYNGKAICVHEGRKRE